MLRNVPRSVVGLNSLVLRSRVRAVSSATPIIGSVATNPIVRLKPRHAPWTDLSRQTPLLPKDCLIPMQQQLQRGSMSSIARKTPLRLLKGKASAQTWEQEDLPVAPILVGGEKFPDNLKLAVKTKAWSGQESERNDLADLDLDLVSEDPDSPPEAQAQAEVEAGDEGAKEGHSGEEGQALDQFNNDETRAEYEDMDGVSLSEEERDAIESLPETSDSAGLSPAGDPATQVSVVSWADGSPVGTRLLDPNVFGIPVRRDVVHEVVRWQLAKRRKGNGKTKRIGETSGSGRKVRPQKGSGRARAGHSRPPHWRGGAKAHGPRQRDFSFKLNRKFVKLGLRVALSARLREGQLTVVDDLTCDSFSTSMLAKTLEARGIPNSATFIVGGDPQPEFVRSSRNIVGTKILAARGANVYDIIKRPRLVLTEGAISHLEEVLEQR